MWLLISFSVALVLLVQWYLVTYGFWKKRGVPTPPNFFPIVGHLGPSITMSKNMGNIYAEIYNKYKDCLYVGAYQFAKPVLIVRDVELLKNMLIKEFSSFHDNDIDIDEKSDPLFGKNPFVLKGHKWKVIRSYVTAAITTGKIKAMFNFMSKISNSLVEYLGKDPNAMSAEGINAKDLSLKFTTDVVAACAFGLDGKSFVDPDSEFQRMGKKLFNNSFGNTIRTIIMFILPPYFMKFLGLKIIPTEVKDWFMGILQETINYREKNNIVRNDYLDLMLSLKSKKGEYEFTDIDVMAQAMTFYADGFETSGTALSFTMYEIAKNKDVQSKLRTEMNKVLEKHGGEITYEGIQEMAYLDMVISETLRMYPPAMFLTKRCTNNYKLPEARGSVTDTSNGIEINPGMSVVVPVYGIHYDPQFYPEPEVFKPERFTDEEKNARPKCAYLPFGEGPRMCLGFRFALAQIKAALVGVVTNFELTVNPKTDPKMEVDPQAFIIAKKGGIWLNFKKLTK